jgi:magnesium chelatase family protein
MSGEAEGQKSEEIQQIVAKARQIQEERFAGTGLHINAEMGPREIKKYCRVDGAAENLIKNAVTSHNLSIRGYHKILKIARTIADLDGKDIIQANHIGEAIAYRIKPENDPLAVAI